jgi:tRNA A37 threonylcarbamoyladenosine synthetase subunit TsaC/SUA5/YrdC
MLEDEIKKYISYIEDGGIIKASSSTIVCVIGDSVKILRDGELSKDIKDNFKIID